MVLGSGPIGSMPIGAGSSQPTRQKGEYVEDGYVEDGYVEDGAVMDSRSWTGISSPRQKARAARTMIPAVMSSIDALITHYEGPGGNGGPPLMEREAILQDLRGFHAALGLLLEAAADEKWSEYGDGLIVDAARWLGRVKTAVKDDPLPFAVAGATEALFWFFGVPGAGIAATAAVAGSKARKKAG